MASAHELTDRPMTTHARYVKKIGGCRPRNFFVYIQSNEPASVLNLLKEQTLRDSIITPAPLPARGGPFGAVCVLPYSIFFCSRPGAAELEAIGSRAAISRARILRHRL
jgi:hypothetical protein